MCWPQAGPWPFSVEWTPGWSLGCDQWAGTATPAQPITTHLALSITVDGRQLTAWASLQLAAWGHLGGVTVFCVVTNAGTPLCSYLCRDAAQNLAKHVPGHDYTGISENKLSMSVHIINISDQRKWNVLFRPFFCTNENWAMQAAQDHEPVLKDKFLRLKTHFQMPLLSQGHSNHLIAKEPVTAMIMHIISQWLTMHIISQCHQ